jgi:imidazolonepropionase
MSGKLTADLILSSAAQVVTFEDMPRGRVGDRVERSTVTNGSVAAHEGSIVFVGSAEECRQRVRLETEGEEIDCRGRVILPGLIDAHTHLPFAGERAEEFRQRLRGTSYEEIARAGGGIRSTVRSTRQADEDELVAGCLARQDRLLAFGVTTAEAKSGYGLSLRDEIRQLRAISRAGRSHPAELIPTLLAAHVVAPEYADRRVEYVNLVINEIIPAVAREKLARFCDVFVEKDGAFTVEEARMILEAARSRGLDLRLHVDQLTAGGGAELAAGLGAASADHLEFVSPAGMKALAAAGTVAVLLPAVDLFLGKKVFPPAVELMEAGVAVALATDCNPGSCMTENLPLAASLACMTTGMDTDEALAGITVQAARSLKLEETHGTLEPGKVADLVVFDVPDRTRILYHFGINHCRTVVKGGEVVVRDRQPDPLH